MLFTVCPTSFKHLKIPTPHIHSNSYAIACESLRAEID